MSSIAATLATMLATTQPGQLDPGVDVAQAGPMWYSSPVWIVIGVVALLLILALIITATRSSTKE